MVAAPRGSGPRRNRTRQGRTIMRRVGGHRGRTLGPGCRLQNPRRGGGRRPGGRPDTLGRRAPLRRQDRNGLRDGFRCETGPNGFLDNAPQTLELADRLGLGERLLRSSDAARRRFILTGGRLRQLPEKPAAFLLSDLLTLRGRLRIIGESTSSRRGRTRPARTKRWPPLSAAASEKKLWRS